MIWDFSKCCYNQRSIPLIVDYFCCGPRVVPAVAGPPQTHTTHHPDVSTARWAPSSLLFLGCSLAFAFAWSHFKLPPSDFLAPLKWASQLSSCRPSATNHSALQRDVSWQSLKEIHGDLEGRTPSSSDMISLLRVNCAFGWTYLSQDELSLEWRKPIPVA